MFPSLFISHGAPNFILQNSISKNNIKNISNKFKKPKYIIIISAHYITNELNIINYDTNELMYDFYGFEKELYEFKYNIKSDKELTNNILNKLVEKNIKCSVDFNRNSYDHGVWTILSLLYEKLDIPVIQLSLPINYSNEKLINLGETLKEFKDEALIICSGGLTHNLRDMSFSPTPKKYATEFNEMVTINLKTGNYKDLLGIDKTILFKQNHPTKEHFLPLFIAIGSAYDKKAKSFNSEIMYSNISMESFIFDN